MYFVEISYNTRVLLNMRGSLTACLAAMQETLGQLVVEHPGYDRVDIRFERT